MTLERTMDLYFAVAALLLGAMWGSFLNVVIHRLPRDESIVRPRSRCPHCAAPIPWYHNLPVLSFVVLRGRCASCRASISWRYPLVEALTAVVTLGVYLRLGPTLEFAIYWPFVLAMIALTFTDLEHMILPDEITLGGTVVGLALSFWNPRLEWWEAFIGAAAGPAFFWTVAKAYEIVRGVEGLGFGDVKLLGLIGAFGGWQALMPTILLSSVAGVVVAVGLMILGRGNMQTKIPYGTFLAPAACVVVLYSDEMYRFYSHLILRLVN